MGKACFWQTDGRKGSATRNTIIIIGGTHANREDADFAERT